MEERQFLIRDIRNGDWLWVYKALISDKHLNASDKLVYQSLASFAGSKKIYPSYPKIAERANLSRRTAINGIKNLIEVGYVAIDRKGNGAGLANEYLLLKMPKGCKFCTMQKGVQKILKKGAKNDTKVVQETTPQQDNNNINKEIDFLKIKTGKQDLYKKMGWQENIPAERK